MPKFIFAYHGGGKPDTPEAGEKVMAAWQAWLAGMGDSCIDPGAPVGLSKTVSANGVADNGGANPLSGYSIINAADEAAALRMARGCPILQDAGGTVEVAPIMEM